MSTCPKCGKMFTKESSVTRHLSQPRTSCHSYMRDIVDISQFMQVQLPRRAVSPSPSAPEPDPDTRVEDQQQFNDFSNIGNDFGSLDDDFGVARESLEEKYEGAGACYSENGLTFLDVFDADEFAEYRKDNLFYPFASKEEWEVADFLLRSSLSMAAIDEFLKLRMVCICTLTQ